MQEHSLQAMRGCPDFVYPGDPACKHMIEMLPQSMYMVDDRGLMVRWSPWFRDRIAGFSDKALLSINFLDLIHPDDRDLISQRMQTVLSQGVEESAEVRVLLKGGPAYRWFLLIANRFERDGRCYVTGTGIDITHLKKAGMALMLSEQRYRSMFEQADSPVFITATDGLIVYVSPAFEALSGYSSHESVGRPFTSFLADKEEGRKAFSLFADVVASALSIRTDEFRMQRKDGSIGYVELKLQRYRDNRTEGAIGVLYDLTQRKRLESLNEFRLRLMQLAEHESIEVILRSAVDQAELLTGSRFGVICFLGDNAHPLPRSIWSTRSQEHAQENQCNEKQHPFEEMAFLRDVVKSVQTLIVNEYHQPPHYDCPPNHPRISRSLTVPFVESGQVVAVLTVANKPSSYDDSDARWVGTLVDMVWDTIARKKAEQSESRIQSILLHIQKMELIGQLAGGIAHDFNNMLGVILGNTELALSSENLDAEVEDNLREIYRAADRSAEMTSQLLAFARKQTAVPRVLDVNSAIGESMDILQRVVGEKIELEWRRSETECKVRIDPSQLDQILMNFCMNARDAMQDEGRIVIESSVVQIDQSRDHAALSGLSGDYVRLSVSDTGQGIPEKYKPHIFEPFFTTKAMGKGTGLGLSSVYGLVKQNRGLVDFESEESVGSTFHVWLPLYRSRAETLVPENDAELVRGSHATILVVEDEPEILNLCRMMLEKSGFTVFAASCPAEAIMIAEERSGKIDLLLTDIVMPEMNGSDLASKLSTISPGFRVLFMSGYSADIIASQGVQNPAINIIRKPFTFKALADKVRKTLEAE